MITPIFPILTSSFSWVLALIGIVGWLKYTSWLIYVPFGLLLLIVILIAPCAIWREQKIRADKAENKLKPCISVTPIVVIEYGRFACIRVTNLGNEVIRNCVGYLRAVYREAKNKHPTRNIISPVCLQWSTRSGGEDKKKELTFTREGDLNVIGFSHGLRPAICVFNSDLRSSLHAMVRQPYHLEFLNDDVLIFDIEISAENCAPLRQKYKLVYNPEGEWDFAVYEATKS